MPKRTLTLFALLVLTTTRVQAEVTPQSVIADYQAQGYARIEVRSGLTQIKVEAIRGTEKVEVILDKTTGAVLKTETYPVGLFENSTPGVSVRERNRDFVRVVNRNDDDSADDNDDSTDDNGGSRNRSGSDDGPSDDSGGDRSDDSTDDGADHDAGDDHGGDDGGNDHGGDNSGSDDD